MAHIQQLKFVSLAEEYFIHEHKPNLNILEIGSYDFNGSVRSFFSGCGYVGVDLCSGPGVDIVCYGHEVSLPDLTFDISISCECFEHDPNWVATFENMYRMTKAGGLVIITCASMGRLEHGTKRTSSEFSPGTQFVGLDYYKNLSRSHFEQAINLKEYFSDFKFFYMPTSFDLYFIGWKIGHSPFAGNVDKFSSAVKKIRKLKRFRLKILDIPVNIARRLVTEENFQDFSSSYYNIIKPFRKFIKSLSHK